MLLVVVWGMLLLLVLLVKAEARGVVTREQRNDLA